MNIHIYSLFINENLKNHIKKNNNNLVLNLVFQKFNIKLNLSSIKYIFRCY